jgi:hypothetical protein
MRVVAPERSRWQAPREREKHRKLIDTLPTALQVLWTRLSRSKVSISQHSQQSIKAGRSRRGPLAKCVRYGPRGVAFICRFQPMAADDEPTTLVGGQIALANEARRGETSAASRGVVQTRQRCLVTLRTWSRSRTRQASGKVSAALSIALARARFLPSWEPLEADGSGFLDARGSAGGAVVKLASLASKPSSTRRASAAVRAFFARGPRCAQSAASERAIHVEHHETYIVPVRGCHWTVRVLVLAAIVADSPRRSRLGNNKLGWGQLTPPLTWRLDPPHPFTTIFCLSSARFELSITAPGIMRPKRSGSK